MGAETAVAVLGAGGHAKVVVATLLASGLGPTFILDDDPARHGKAVLGVEVVGGISELHRRGVRRAVLAIGDNRERRRVSAELDAAGPVDWATAVHPAATVHSSARLGPGTVVFAGAIVQPEAILGAHVIVNTAASIDHDCRLGDYVHVAPGASLAGEVVIGEGSLLGIGCRVLPGRRVGTWAVVGGGATVVRDIADGWTVVGTPARRLAGSRIELADGKVLS